jgi:hypothetical protein
MNFNGDDEALRLVGLVLQAIQSRYSPGRPLFHRIERLHREVMAARHEVILPRADASGPGLTA